MNWLLVVGCWLLVLGWQLSVTGCRLGSRLTIRRDWKGGMLPYGSEPDMPARRTKPKTLRLPRAPLPRQTGGVHEDKTKRPFRRRKHKGKGDERG